MGTVNYFDWNMGVNDETLHSGIIKNTNYVNGSGNKKYFSGDLEFSFSEDDDPIKNYQILEGYLLPQGNNLEVEIIPSTGSDTYTIKDCYEIKHIARYLKSGIEAIISSSVITLPFGPAITITNYDSRFTSNNLGGILACRITNPNTNDTYLRSFTISGQNITLKSITPDSDGVYQIQSITGISTNWRFELISAFDIVKSGTQLESVFQGYVIKTIENGEGTIKFTKFDTPEKLSNEFVAIVYVKLEKMKPQDINMQSILQHDIFTDTKQIDFALIQSQLDLLKENLIKYNNPLRKVVLKTRRPTILEYGDEVYFNVTDVIQDTLKVIDKNEEYINQNGELEDKPFRVITYTFANYIDDFAKLLSTFQLKDEINKIQLAKKQQFNYTAELIISCTNELDTSNNATFVSKPKNLSYEFVNANSEPQNNYLILSWDSVTEATDYYVEISLNNTFTHLIAAEKTDNYNNIDTYSDFTKNNNLFYARVKTENKGIFSDWSDTLEIEKNPHLSFPSSITGAWGTLALDYGFIFNPNSSGDFTDYSSYNRSVSFFGSGTNPTWVNDNSQWGLDFSSSNNKGLSFIADGNLISSTENTFIIEYSNLIDPSVPQGLFTVWTLGGIGISTGGGGDTSKIFVNTTDDYGSNHQVKTNNSQIGTAIISYSIKCQSGAEDYVFVRNQTNQSLTGTAITDISSFRNINGIRAMIGNFYTDGNFMSNAQFRGVIKRFAIIKQKLTDAQIKEIHRLMGYT